MREESSFERLVSQIRRASWTMTPVTKRDDKVGNDPHSI